MRSRFLRGMVWRSGWNGWRGTVGWGAGFVWGYNLRLAGLDRACQACLKYLGLLAFVVESGCGDAVTAIKRLPTLAPTTFRTKAPVLPTQRVDFAEGDS